MENFLHYFLLFFLYSVLGWLIETLDILITKKKLVNRGFLIGPYCPIYGFGSIIMLLYLSQYKNNIITVFLLGAIICSILEYITSYILEKIFNARWWDYSNFHFNLNGRICLENTILFGILGIILLYIINPIIYKLIKLIPHNIILIITIIFLIIFIIDTIISCNITEKLQNTFTKVSNIKDNTDEIKEKVFKLLKENKKLYQKRILNSFPNFKINQNHFMSQKNKPQ